MVLRCIAYGCSGVHSDGVSLHKFPKDSTLRRQWVKQVLRTRADWKGPSEYSILYTTSILNLIVSNQTQPFKWVSKVEVGCNSHCI